LGAARFAALALALTLALVTRTGNAWIEHEHEYVVLEAFARMLEEKPKEMAILGEIWKLARKTHPDVLCEGVVISARNGSDRGCIGFSMLVALALPACSTSASPRSRPTTSIFWAR